MLAAIPLGDASRRPTHFPLVTATLIVANVSVFVLELLGGDEFGLRWAALLTCMLPHGGWLHIISDMVFPWAFGPEVEGALGRRRYAAHVGGLVFGAATARLF